MKKIVLLCTLCVCIFTGCNKGPKDSSEQDRQVVVFFATKSTTNSLLKSGGSDDENLISRIILFAVDDENNVVKTITPSDNPLLDEPLLSGIQLTLPRKTTSLYAIANPSIGLETANPLTVSDLMDLVGDFSDAPQSPFLMGGKGNASGYNVNIQLTRAVAKIKIIGKNNFQIATVTVADTPDKGYVFKEGTLSIPLSAGITSYPAVSSADPVLYVAENTSTSPTRFIVTGQFQGKQASYPIILKDGGQNIDIVRNTCYEVSISPQTDVEYTITIEIVEWNDVKTDEHFIPDEDFIDP